MDETIPDGTPGSRRRVYVPAPRHADTDGILVGAMTCPLWKEGTRGKVWEPLAAYPERTPLLGYYDEGNPEVTDWEVTWALDHGIGFFLPCWYRARGNLGKPAQPILGHWLHEGLFRCRYGSRIRFAILWENTNGIACGVDSERDLLDNVLPFWVRNYFRRPNYLRLDGKPVLFIYGPAALAAQLGGQPKMRDAVDRMRDACKKAGLGGLVVFGENHVDRQPGDQDPLRQMAEAGLDCSFSYHWPTFTRRRPPGQPPEASAIIEAQEACWQDLASGPLPAATTVSMGWDSRPWGAPAEAPRWQLAPEPFRQLCERAKARVMGQPDAAPASRMVLIDNWNEFGEGHYVFPTRQYGFGYLDAIRETFSRAPKTHKNLVPEDVGLGPYDRLYRASRS